MDLSIRGRVALITGGSKGIGLATARMFAEEGCRVSIGARGGEGLLVAEAELQALDAKVLATQADITLARGDRAACPANRGDVRQAGHRRS